jgi:hypothetical protein
MPEDMWMRGLRRSRGRAKAACELAAEGEQVEDSQTPCAVGGRNSPCFSEGAQLAGEGAQVEGAQMPCGGRRAKFAVFQRRCATGGRRRASRRCGDALRRSGGEIRRVSAKVRNWRAKARKVATYWERSRCNQKLPDDHIQPVAEAEACRCPSKCKPGHRLGSAWAAQNRCFWGKVVLVGWPVFVPFGLFVQEE